MEGLWNKSRSEQHQYEIRRCLGEEYELFESEQDNASIIGKIPKLKPFWNWNCWWRNLGPGQSQLSNGASVRPLPEANSEFWRATGEIRSPWGLLLWISPWIIALSVKVIKTAKRETTVSDQLSLRNSLDTERNQSASDCKHSLEEERYTLSVRKTGQNRRI